MPSARQARNRTTRQLKYFFDWKSNIIVFGYRVVDPQDQYSGSELLTFDLIGTMSQVEEKINKETHIPFWRRWIHHIVPTQFNDIFGLVKRLVTSRSLEAWSAMLYAFMGVVLTPLDLILQQFEKGFYQKANSPQLPQIFVCGAPRSGTTLTAQVLIKHLPVFYFNNLTSLFPRSPITASKLFGLFLKNNKDQISYVSFYGRTARLSAPNDALYFWDRWIGADRTKLPESISADNQDAIVRFFGAFESYSKKPLVAKNNNLNTYAHLIGEILDTAYFICLDRDPVYLAQSHLIARRLIHGDESIAYGIRSAENEKAEGDIDPLEDICRQVLFNRQRIKQQQEKLGQDRFIIICYEDFCADPAKWVAEISARILGKPIDAIQLGEILKPFPSANKRKVNEATFLKIKETFNGLKREGG